jgi:superfamily II RNA helicase
MESFLNQLNFELDTFQLEALQTIHQGHSVVVCAPTGSGKTIIAEFAATEAIDKGVKLFYTTPLKALSNQKYFDLKNRFGEQNVGLLTGDISINREARIVVMTTEVFRNMLYGLNEDRTLMQNVGYVVLDECHFMNDAERGTVWEESIIYCPESIQIIALSATVANAQELTNWINQVHHDTRLISSDVRPVPLKFSYYNREKLMQLFEAPGRLNKLLKNEHRGNRMANNVKMFRPNHLIAQMNEKEMLPAIFFTFSRKGCDKYLRETRGLQLLTPEQRVILKDKVAEFVAQNPFLANNPMLEYIENGFASHHAGLLPGLKMLVESLFQQGLIQVVFATETLAAGINMPARSTVITSISKRTNEGHRMLTASEFLQMSGRAGRRGLDSVGYVVIVSSPYRGAHDAAVLASSPADGLNSQFTATYGMVLNLLQKYSLDEARYLISKSFGQFTAERRLKPTLKEIQQKSMELQHYVAFQCPADLTDGDFNKFLKSREMLVDSSKQVQILKGQVKRFGPSSELVQELEREKGKRDNLKQTVETMACYTCRILDEHKRNEDRIRRLQRQLKGLNSVYESEKDIYWRNFHNIAKLLQEAGHLDEATRPTPKGLLTAQIRSENEFFMSELIHKGLFDGLEPETLAGVLCALVNDSTRENLQTQLPLSPQGRESLEVILKEMKRVHKLQEKHRVQVPLNHNPIASGLVEAWCQNLPWDQLIAATNIDEGDLVRLTRRTADLLRQFSRIPDVPGSLAATARTALLLLYRDPIKELDITEESDIPAALVEQDT